MISIKLLSIETTEEMVMRPELLAEPLRGWRYYRIEYGGTNQDCLWEGRIMLPPTADPDALVQLLLGMQAHGQIWQ